MNQDEMAELTKLLPPTTDDDLALQNPSHSHALGCPYNGLPVIECSCGLPNKPKDS